MLAVSPLSRSTYADHVDADALALGAVASAAPASTAVPTCEGWTLADLTWHVVGRTWGCRFGRMVGTSPTSGQHHDLEALRIEDVPTSMATLAGPAEVLDLWLWGRAPLGRVAVEGDRDVAARLRSLVAEAAQ